ncbi:hypothetical protein PVAND_003717 [Polypedilum vanderplanki]|uniref:Uncharacterized protein n=1 Tax=Polypedilum vanderplanki TaxID=319348 RepID=A0A9J6BWR1_POLVA|nr:hypothetical protein PVAND_003717 [Polypedilum vanderplanki]
MSKLKKHFPSEMILLGSFIIFFHLITNANAFCPSKCTCDNVKAKCIGAALEVLPQMLNPNVKHINLTDNKITSVHFSLSFYTLLETLDISNNSLQTLGVKNFVSQENLKKLFLQQNSIRKLSKETFKGMKELQFLDLSNNQIMEIDPHSFNELMRLSYLDLSNNILISIEQNVFQNLIGLETLLLTNNQLLKIPHQNNFEFLYNLVQLDLSSNLIKQIENNSFQYTNKLRKLQLNGNVINIIDMLAFDGLVQLQFLDLSDNNLTYVPTEQLSKLSNLTHLALDGNFIESIGPVSFLNLFQLRKLQLSRLSNLAKVDTRAFIDNVNLEEIVMNDNGQLSSLPLNLFHGNLNLIELNLNNNKFYQLDAIQIPIDQLKRLSLGDNPFVCNCSLIWLWHLVKLSSEYINSSNSNNKSSNLFIIDKDKIGCDIIVKGGDDNEVKVIRKMLVDMTESEISCPTNLLTMISVILTVIFIGIICISIFVIIKCSNVSRKRQQQQKCFSNSEVMIPQKVDKSELERYLAEQHYQHKEKLHQYTINSRVHEQYNFQQQQPQNNVNNPGGYHSLKNWEQNPNSLTNFNSFNSKNSLNNPKHSSSNADDDEDDIKSDEDHYENFEENYFNTINQNKKMPLATITTHSLQVDRGNNKGSKTNIKPHIVYV